MIELVYKRYERFLQLGGIAHLYLGAGLKAVLRIDKHHAHVGNLERREKPATEVVRSGGVYDVELGVLEFGKQNSRIDRPFIYVFQLGIVGEGVVGLYTTPAVYNLSLESHSFGKGSFPGARRTEQYDILDVASLISFHSRNVYLIGY